MKRARAKQKLVVHLKLQDGGSCRGVYVCMCGEKRRKEETKGEFG